MTKTKLLGLVSFCIMMEGGDRGIMGKAPSYISEKAKFLFHPCEMYDALDDENQQKVIEWGKHWKVDFESLTKEMMKDYWDIPADEFRKKYDIE